MPPDSNSAKARQKRYRAARLAKGYANVNWLMPPEALANAAILRERLGVSSPEAVARALEIAVSSLGFAPASDAPAVKALSRDADVMPEPEPDPKPPRAPRKPAGSAPKASKAKKSAAPAPKATAGASKVPPRQRDSKNEIGISEKGLAISSENPGPDAPGLKSVSEPKLAKRLTPGQASPKLKTLKSAVR